MNLAVGRYFSRAPFDYQVDEQVGDMDPRFDDVLKCVIDLLIHINSEG